MPLEIKVKEQITVLEIKSGDNIVTIESTATLPPSYNAIISKFFEIFQVVKVETRIPASQKDKEFSDIKLPIKV
jgi:hypothetical protein